MISTARSRAPRRRRAGRADRRGGVFFLRRTVRSAGEFPAHQRVLALSRSHRGADVDLHRAGLRRGVGFDRSDSAARRRESRSVAVSARSIPTDNGESSRYGFTFQGAWRNGDAETRASAFATKYDLGLFSNFTYFLDDPVDGDQFQQFDDRWVIGGTVEREWTGSRHERTDAHDGRPAMAQRLCRRSRAASRGGWRPGYDDALGSGGRAQPRPLCGTRDALERHCSGSWRGLRGDFYRFDVDSDLPANSGTDDDFIASPKLSAIWSVAKRTELYASAGTGFHSNDARGTTITIDPRPAIRRRQSIRWFVRKVSNSACALRRSRGS